MLGALLLLSAFAAVGLFIGGSDDDGDETAEDRVLREDDHGEDDLFEGSNKAETMIGNDDGSQVNGLGGDDILLGNGGNDSLDGGAGDDTINGGLGNDLIHGQKGADSVLGGPGNDRIFMSDGNDTYGSSGNTDEEIAGMLGDDYVKGGDDQDRLIDHHGSDTLLGNLGHDYIDARDHPDTPGADVVFGGYGNDTMLFDAGDEAEGGEGKDQFHLWLDEDDLGDPATILDFDPDEDQLEIFLGRPPEDGDPEISLMHDDTTDTVTVMFGDKEIATLLDVGKEDFDKMEVKIVG